MRITTITLNTKKYDEKADTMKKLIFLIALSLSMTFGNGSNSQAAERTAPASGQPPVTAAMLLEREPLIKGIDYDIPATADEIAGCTFSSTSEGYTVKDGSGKTLRTFFSRPGGGIQAGYYKNGVEVFRQFNDPRDAKKPNEFRWFNNAGSRHGTGNPGAIQWQMISAEELSAEVVSALATKNAAQFMSLVPKAEEIQTLGLSKDLDAKVKQKVAQMQPGFAEAVTKIALSPNAVWIQFSGGKPGAVPSEKGGNSQDIVAYENAVVLVQDGEGENSVKQIQLGTLVKLGDNNWRLIGTPQLDVPGASHSFADYTFFSPGLFGDTPPGNMAAQGAPSSDVLKMLEEIDKKQAAIRSVPVDQRAALYEDILKLMLQCAMKQSSHEQAEYWVRQAADIVEGGAIANEYPNAPKRLGELFTSVKEQFPTLEAAAYVKFRQIMADYYLQLHSKTDPSEVNVNRVKSLKEFITEFEGTEGAARAMSELASYYEMVQDTNEALQWYQQVETAAPNLIQGKRATGAIRRLTSIGKVVPFTAKASNGAAFNLAQLKGNIVVLYFWSSWSEPESSGLKSIASQNKNLRVIGVNLDTRAEDMAKYLEKNPMPFPQIHETAPDGESVPALYWGVQIPPMIILIDAEGKVVAQDLATAGMLARALEELKK